MDAGKAVVVNCYSSNFVSNWSNSMDFRWTTKLKVRYKETKIKDVYLITFNVDVTLNAMYRFSSLLTFTDFQIYQPNFDPETLYRERYDEICEMANISYNHSRILFSEKTKGVNEVETTYLPVKTFDEIKKWVTDNDVYNNFALAV